MLVARVAAPDIRFASAELAFFVCLKREPLIISFDV